MSLIFAPDLIEISSIVQNYAFANVLALFVFEVAELQLDHPNSPSNCENCHHQL